MIQPEQLGPFRIIRVIGRGGMGAVYEGAHFQTNETVAVKVLVAPVDVDDDEDDELRLRFELEIETLKKLRHPNIVRIYGYGEEDPYRFYVMELIHGQSLQQELRRNRTFTWQEVCKLAWEMSQALKHAHDRGIIHRDIKPANILLQNDGLVKLSDYGIAHIFGSNRLTHINSVVGTLEYMSPEQSQGGPITPKSDFFSLGAVLYTLLIGKPPYQAKTLPEIVKNHQFETPERIRVTRPDVPETFESIIYELLKIKPEHRPVNAYILGRRLQVILRAFIGNPGLITIKPSDHLLVPPKESHFKSVPAPASPPVNNDSGQGPVDFKNSKSVNSQKSRSVEIETDSTEKELPHDLEFSLQEENDTPSSDTTDQIEPNAQISIPGMDTFRLYENKLDPSQQPDTPDSDESKNNDQNGNKSLPNSGLDKKRSLFTLHDFTWTSLSPSKAISAFQPKLNTRMEHLIHDTFDDENDESKTLNGTSNNHEKNFFDPASMDSGDLYGGPKVGGNPVRSDFIRKSPTSEKPNVEKEKRVPPTQTIERLRLNSEQQPPPDRKEPEKDRKSRVHSDNPSDCRNVSEFSLKRELTRWNLKRQAKITKSRKFAPENPQPQQSENQQEAHPNVHVFENQNEGIAEKNTALPKNIRESVQKPQSKREGTSKFVVFKEDELGDYTAKELNPPGQIISVQTLLASFCLIVSGLFCWYMLQPIPADTLYERITREIGGNDKSVSDENIRGLLRAEDKINLFLSQYPNDPRHEELHRYTEELKLNKLQREFANRSVDVTNFQPIERACIEAFAISKSQPEKAVEMFQAIIDLYGPANVPDSKRHPETERPEVDLVTDVSSPDGSEVKPEPIIDDSTKSGRPRSEARSDLCIELARRRLAAIKATLEPILAEQKEFIRTRLEDAKELDQTKPDQARAIREAIIELYQDKNWATQYIEDAKKLLEK